MRRISKKRQQEIADKLKADEVESAQNEGTADEGSSKLPLMDDAADNLSVENIDGSAESTVFAPIPSMNSAPMLLFDEEVQWNLG